MVNCGVDDDGYGAGGGDDNDGDDTLKKTQYLLTISAQ